MVVVDDDGDWLVGFLMKQAWRNSVVHQGGRVVHQGGRVVHQGGCVVQPLVGIDDWMMLEGLGHHVASMVFGLVWEEELYRVRLGVGSDG